MLPSTKLSNGGEKNENNSNQAQAENQKKEKKRCQRRSSLRKALQGDEEGETMPN